VKSKDEWKPAATLLPPLDGKPRDYVWDVSNFVGQTLRVAVVDEDKRPGCYVVCSGFRFIPHDIFEGGEFKKFMIRLTERHRLPPVSRFESKHFVAISNSEDAFTEHRLNNCELIYDLFYDHFHKKGFRIHEPGVKLMVAIFDSQAGFEAYLGQKMSAAVTGVYHPPSNRLLVYDYGQNEAFVPTSASPGRRAAGSTPTSTGCASSRRSAGVSLRGGATSASLFKECASLLGYSLCTQASARLANRCAASALKLPGGCRCSSLRCHSVILLARAYAGQ